jgi:hypothetical protein
VLRRDLHFDSGLFNDIIESNKRWQQENAERAPVEERVISDVNHGTEWEKHHFLGAADYEGELRLAFTAYADDVDIPNPIGAAAGHHKMTFVYTTCLNRDISQRTRIANINLATIVLSKDLKEFTPAVVISGAENEPHDSSSLGACLRRLEEGVALEVPSEADPPLFRGWLFNFVGDAPAVAEMAGTKISLSKAKNVCNMCENANRPLVYQPCRWIGCKCTDDRKHDRGCPCPFALRTAARDAEHKEAATDNKLQELGVTTWENAFVRIPTGGRSLAQQPGPKDAMHVWLEGITKSLLSYTVWMMTRAGWCSKQELTARMKQFAWPQQEKGLSRPSYLPKKIFQGHTARGVARRGGRARGRGRGIWGGRGSARISPRAAPSASPSPAPSAAQHRRPTRNQPQRATRTPARDPEASDSEHESSESSDVDALVDLDSEGEQSVRDNEPSESEDGNENTAGDLLSYAQGIPTPNKPHSVPGFTAHHMLVLALHSLEVFRPFVPENARANFAFWDVWVYQVYILQMIMKPSFTHNDLEQLDTAVFRMFSAFETVPQYKGFWVPKFHFASHAAMDILRFGPTRCNWCIMYEAKNQPMKKGCKRSNFHNPPKSTAQYWVDSSDHHLRKKQKRPPIVEATRVEKTGKLETFPELQAELEAMSTHAGITCTDAEFHMLRGATKHGIFYYPQSFALVPNAEGTDTICRIQHIFKVGSNCIYMIIDAFPPSVVHHDENGVMYTETTELNAMPTTYTIISLESSAVTALWSFEDGERISFITKW